MASARHPTIRSIRPPDDLGTLGGSYVSSAGTGINNSGQVVGYSDTQAIGVPTNFSRSLFRTAANQHIEAATDVIASGPAIFIALSANGINDVGQVVGSVQMHNGPSYAFRSAPNGADVHLYSLAWLSGQFNSGSSYGYGINNSGQVVGSASMPTGETHAFRTAPNMPINPATDDLGTLGSSYVGSVGTGINNFGQVIGFSNTANRQSHGFRTAANSPINPATDDLGTLGGTSSSASSINDAGQVVGFSNTATGQSHGFLYSGALMYDLNDLIPAGSAWELTQASGINDVGQIAGTGILNGVTRAFRLDPFTLVTIDIKPGDDPPTINARSTGKTPVAILSGTSFNAPVQVDQTSLTFGRTGDEKSLAFCSGPEDVNQDGLPDLVCHFNTTMTGFQVGDTTGVLKGKTVEAIPIEGKDSVRVIH